jgi:hypothetical protein
MLHTMGIVVGFAMIIGGLAAFGVWAWHSTLPKREYLPKHSYGKTDLVTTTYDEYFDTHIRTAEQPVVPKHYRDHTAEFSAVPAGENKHFVDETREMRVVSLPPVPKP